MDDRVVLKMQIRGAEARWLATKRNVGDEDNGFDIPTICHHDIFPRHAMYYLCRLEVTRLRTSVLARVRLAVEVVHVVSRELVDEEHWG